MNQAIHGLTNDCYLLCVVYEERVMEPDNNSYECLHFVSNPGESIDIEKAVDEARELFKKITPENTAFLPNEDEIQGPTSSAD